MQKIFYQGNKRKQVPSNASITKLESFFGCAATLMTHQLQHLLLHSIQDFTDLIVQPAVSSLSHTHYQHCLSMYIQFVSCLFCFF